MIDTHRFLLPGGTSFDIPRDWWVEAGMVGFERHALAYRTQDINSVMLAIKDIAPLDMSGRQHLDFGGFDRIRMVSVLRGIADEATMPPIKVERSEGPYPYKLNDGTHRFYASVAAGFLMVPTITVARWVPEVA